VATAAKTYFIQQGTPVVAAAAVSFLGIGSQGTPEALRILTHPNPSLAPLTYWGNPDRDINIDNDVLVTPIVRTVETEDDTKVIRFERLTRDVVVEEIWLGNDRRAAMPSFFLRQLIEYWLNPPALTGNPGEFITWEPRDRNSRTWQVEFVGLTVGGEEGRYDFKDVRARGGLFKGGAIANPLDPLNPVETGIADREVRLSLKVVAEVV